jgi:hypothetical protein
MNSAGFWPIEPEPLQEGEIEVTHRQLEQLALLAEKEAVGGGCQAEAMLKICPDLRRDRVNRLVVRGIRSAETVFVNYSWGRK